MSLVTGDQIALGAGGSSETSWRTGWVQSFGVRFQLCFLLGLTNSTFCCQCARGPPQEAALPTPQNSAQSRPEPLTLRGTASPSEYVCIRARVCTHTRTCVELRWYVSVLVCACVGVCLYQCVHVGGLPGVCAWAHVIHYHLTNGHPRAHNYMMLRL